MFLKFVYAIANWKGAFQIPGENGNRKKFTDKIQNEFFLIYCFPQSSKDTIMKQKYGRSGSFYNRCVEDDLR